jgi:glycosyltransferase involved in cell wall biosynthesis
MSLDGRRVLYISYNGMLEPLGQSQVIPYLRELATEGVEFSLLSFERAAAFTPQGQEKCQALKKQLSASGVDWHWLRYHKRPSIPATSFDILAGIRYASNLVKQKRIELVHARSHIAAAIALVLKKRFGPKMIFDVRGLMAEEYVDAGHWTKGNAAYRLTKSAERRAFAASDGIVTLTERIWPIISEWNGLRSHPVAHQVVPCCADLELFKFRQEDRDRRRAQFKVGKGFVLVYSGSIGGWYLTEEMVGFYAELLKQQVDAHFLWLTTGDRKLIDAPMRNRGVPAECYSVCSVPIVEVPSYLSAADAGIAFYKPAVSRLATSPVKVTEYLACGLPVIINEGIGDSDCLIQQHRVGMVVQGFTPKAYTQAIAASMSSLDNVSGVRQRARVLAEEYFDVRNVGRSRYAKLYEEVLSKEPT